MPQLLLDLSRWDCTYRTISLPSPVLYGIRDMVEDVTQHEGADDRWVTPGGAADYRDGAV